MKLGSVPKRVLVAVAFGLVAVGVSRLLDWGTPVRLAATTTYISAPLAEDGLPNFTQAMVDHQREEVTLENNGARPFWQAIGPSELSPDLFEAICRDLQIEIDRGQPFLVSTQSDELKEQVAQWILLRALGFDNLEDLPDLPASPEQIDAAANFIADAQSRPWTAEQMPPLADWVSANQAQLDLLVEASRKPRFFSPPPNLVLDPHTSAVAMMLPHAQEMRVAIRALATRAMNRVADGDPAAAWDDVFACWRFGEQIGSGPTIIELLVGVAIRSVAMNATLPILDSPDLTRETAEQILADLESLKPRLDLFHAVNFGDRLMTLDSALRMTTGRLGGVEDAGEPENITFIDPNIPLEMVNSFADRMAQAVALDDWMVRGLAIDELYDELDRLSQLPKSTRVQSFFSRAARSKAVGAIVLSSIAPALESVVDAHERDETHLTLLRTAAALAIYRIDQGDYPLALVDLEMARILKQIPNDPFTRAPFRYERRGDGYLLYSLFENRTDDGGSDWTHPIVNGEWTSQAEDSPSTNKRGDLVICLPLPPLELPTRPTAKTAEP